MPPRRSGRGGHAQAPPRIKRLPVLPGPHMNEDTILQHWPATGLKDAQTKYPRDPIAMYFRDSLGAKPVYNHTQGDINGAHVFRVTVHDPASGLTGVGDDPALKNAERLAALSLLVQLHSQGLLNKQTPKAPEDVTLSDGTKLTYERAQTFMDFYCLKYGFSSPALTTTEGRGKWETVMTVGGRRIGIGIGKNKKLSTVNCYLDVVQYLDSCDSTLWPTFLTETKGRGDALGFAPPVWLHVSGRLHDRIKDLSDEIQESNLYKNRPNPENAPVEPSTSTTPFRHYAPPPSALQTKSDRLKAGLESYRVDPKYQAMRSQREHLPIFTRSSELLETINSQQVTICMAATGSGKTTQIPQIILDDWIDRGDGAQCNILCTQPRRIAAISVAERVARERGETVGNQVGYQVRFDAKLPQQHGSITFCTTGIFLKRMQSALAPTQDDRSLDDITHIVIDEVHERDVDTDLTLVVLKRLIADRRARNKPLKVILMSATIDPTLFQTYFADEMGHKAKTIDIPGRSFPVEKHYLEEIVGDLAASKLPRTAGWLLNERNVREYLERELGPTALPALQQGLSQMIRPVPVQSTGEESEIPFGLVALTIAHVLRSSEEGHVLVFLPGWEEISAVRNILQDPGRYPLLGHNFNDASKYSVHVLHSTVPVGEQQAVFEPPPAGVRRIILSTNIAETSVTIPDVVYVVDTGRVKEKRYDPERHMSSLVSAWVGTSNLNQRAGRAGRHRPGQYYGLISKSRVAALDPYQLVEMKRVDLSNVVMHVKALDFPNMGVEEIFAALIEPPAPDRVEAALQTLNMVGALDHEQRLTSLGRVLLQIPIDAAMARLVLYGCLFKCLDQALSLAALMTNREPFMAPVALKREANAAKARWSPSEFQSDALATLRAYNAWWALQSTGQYSSANQFCSENFLSKPTLMMVQKIKQALLLSLYQAGVIDVAAGGRVAGTGSQLRGRNLEVPAELNINSESLPLLASLIAIGSQPNFATRVSERIYRTYQDKTTFIHPSSVNSDRDSKDKPMGFEKSIIAFTEKVRNVSVAQSSGNSAQTFLRTTTKLDPMTYLLFGAYQTNPVDKGVECDDWLPLHGNALALRDIQQLKVLIDTVMLRVYTGISIAHHERRQSRLQSRTRNAAPIPADPIEEDEESGDRDDDDTDVATKLSRDEILELDFMTRDVVRVLEMYNEERQMSQSRRPSRPGTPFSARASPSAGGGSLQLPASSGGSMFSLGLRGLGSHPGSGANTPSLRPSTPLRRQASFK